MEFNLSEEQIILKQTVKKFTEREIEPVASQIDSQGMLPDGLLKKMAEIHLPGMIFPLEYGGSNAS